MGEIGLFHWQEEGDGTDIPPIVGTVLARG